MATLVDIARDPEYIEAALSAFDDHKRSTSGIEIEAERRRLQGELEGLRQQEQATVRAQIAGIRAGASAEAYAAVFADIAKKRLTVEKRLLQLTPQQEVQEEIPQDTAAKIAKIAEEIVKVLSASELKSGEKQAILTTIIKSIIPTEEGLEIQLNASNHKIIKTACPHDCPDTCSMLAFVQDGKLLRVAGNPDNPYTRGNLCRKVAHYEERVYSPDRLLHPLRRVGKKGVGQFERISWDEALAEIARNWKAVIRESGPEAIMPYSYAGTMGVVSMSACDTRLWYRMGATQLLRTICSSAAKVGAAYVNGPNGGMDPEDFANSQFIIAWGTNLSSTNVHQMPIIREAQAKGAVFVVIDPYKTRTANAADWFIQPKPGTDAALALGMANILFTEGLHDEAFLEAHSVGWREFRERCAEYPPERVAQITGLEVAEILKLARDYATITPSAIRLGTGLSRTANGGGMIRAISCLPAVIGAWGKPASGIVRSTGPHFPLNMNRVHRPDLLHSPDDESPVQWGRAVPRAVNMNELGKALRDVTDPPLRSLYIFDCNPAAVAPNASLVRQGLAREDIFTVVHEQMMTDTARYADILLPATSQMECLDLMAAYGHLYVNLCQPAIPPLGESRANIEVINALAKAMGYDDPVFDETAEDVIRAALNSDHPFLQGITYESLLETGFAHLNTPTTPYVPFVNGEGFPTPSGKVELYSERAAQDGYDPLPNYEPPAESAEADPELAAEFPVNLLSPAAHHFLNSTFSNVASLQKSEKEPRIWVNPQDAQERGVGDGDWLRVWEPARLDAAQSGGQRECASRRRMVAVAVVESR